MQALGVEVAGCVRFLRLNSQTRFGIVFLHGGSYLSVLAKKMMQDACKRPPVR